MRLVVVGTGLIGGSFALAARRHGVFDEVLGVEPDPVRRQRARDLALVDDLVDAVPEQADAVLLAGPSDTIGAWAACLRDHPGVLFDAGSLKGAVLAAVREATGTVPPRFVACHPLTGSERSGPDAADAGLFEGAEVILTPAPETDPEALAQVAGWWRAVGGRTTRMDPARHDEVLAVTSHLPHLVAFAYLQQVGDEHLRHAAGGFRDFSRIGGADPEVWAPIFAGNRTAVLGALDDLEGDLQRIRALLENDDIDALKDLLEAAGARRRRWDHDH